MNDPIRGAIARLEERMDEAEYKVRLLVQMMQTAPDQSQSLANSSLDSKLTKNQHDRVVETLESLDLERRAGQSAYAL